MKHQVRVHKICILEATIAMILFLGSLMGAAAATDNTTGVSDQDVQNLASSAPKDRSEAEHHIQAAGPTAIPTLIKGLDNSNQTVRERAAWLLRQLSYQFKSLPNDIVATGIGQRVHSEKDHKARMQMVNVLRDYAGPVATRELKRVALEDSDWDIRLYAVHFVASTSLDAHKELEFLKKATHDGNKAVQLSAYCELARLGDISQRPLALQTIGQSSDWYERREAISILGAIGNPADLPLLQGLIDSKNTDAELRLRAVHEYQNIKLSQLPLNARLDHLIRTLDDPSWAVRNWAYVRLWKFQDPDTNNRLKQYLGEKGHHGYDEAGHALELR